jgi:dTDP-4-dehydrorhamnose 3,5-epimerase
MGRMTPVPTALAGLFEILSPAAADARGCFRRLFCERDLAVLRDGLHFTQINLSRTRARGTVRGMHFQSPPAAEAKLIHCLRGRVFDVAIDVRRGSPTFLHWHAFELSADDDRAVFIPEGFAHGFQSLSDDVELLYMHTAPWTAECEHGLRHDDPLLRIAWPLPVGAVSDRDRDHPLIDERFNGVAL